MVKLTPYATPVTVAVSFDPVAEFVKVTDRNATPADAVVPHKPLKIEILPNSSSGKGRRSGIYHEGQ